MNCLKTYKLTLKTVGPVFVGSGKDISKKEYIFSTKNEAQILDVYQLYAMLKKMGKEKAYETYLLENSRDDMKTWMKKENISFEKVKPFVKYTLKGEDIVVENMRRLQILEMVKDPYGNPYIPGSSLKGMLRTILLSQNIRENKSTYERELDGITNEIFSNNRTSRNTFLKKKMLDVESKCFHTLQRENTDWRDAVNDYMQGVIVSDSNPIAIDNLILSQRIELHTDGRESRLPVLRECIKPGTDIEFTLTIDTSISSLDDKKIMEAIKSFLETYYRWFGRKFPGIDKLRVNQVFLGGACGFTSKTVAYPLFMQQGLNVTKAIFKKTNVPRQHMHEKDDKYGVSPHIMKCSKYQGKMVQMGLCNLKIEKMD